MVSLSGEIKMTSEQREHLEKVAAKLAFDAREFSVDDESRKELSAPRGQIIRVRDSGSNLLQRR